MSERKILIVDDSRTSLFMESMILKRHHYAVVTAGDGEEAMALVRSEHPDLVLMDVVMPKKTGVEACRALKADPVTRDIPVILVTTRGEGENVEIGYEAGCNDYVTKPVNGVELIAKVRDWLGA